MKVTIELPTGDFPYKGEMYIAIDMRPPKPGEIMLSEQGPCMCKSEGLTLPKIILGRKPKKFEPWTFDTMPIGVKVRHVINERTVNLALPRDEQYVCMSGSPDISYSTLYDHWIQLDGTPCGTEITK